MKRIIAAILSVVMVLSLLTAQAFAAGKEMKVSVTGVKDLNAIEEGQTITVSVKLPENTSMAGATFELTYDADYFEVTNATSDLIGSDEISKKAGKVVVAYLNTQMKNANFTKNQNMLTVALKATGKVGTSSITLTKQDCGALDGSKLIDYGYTAPAATSVTTVAKQVAVSKITVSPKTLNLEVGQKFQLAATVKPDEATDKTVTWKVTKGSDVVSVSADGEVTAIKAGSATITAAAGGKTATCKVTVKVPVCNHSEDKLTHVDGKAATCTEDGVKEHYLCTCGTKLDLDKKTVLATTVIPATGHKTEKEENKATCAKLAVCDVCGESYGSLKKHTVVKVDKVDPTCNTPGVKAHYECSVCGKWFSDKNGTKEIAEADKASYVIPADPDMHVYDIVKDSYKEYDEGYYVEQFRCTKCGDSYWLASVDLRNVDVKLVQDGKGDLKNAKVEVASTSVKTKEVMSLYYNDTVNAGDTLSLPVFFNYSKSATEAEAIAALKKDIAENSTFTVKAAATKSGWKFTTDKTYTVTVELDDAGKIVTKWVGSDNTEVSAENTPTFTITGKKTTGGGGNGGSGNGGSTTTDTTKTDGKKVESGKTFDAGIAMYVGLSVLSVTGGALVIGKKKERF